MAEQPLEFEELSALVAALCDGTIDGEGFARLEQLLAADPAARRWYIAYMDLHGDLCWDHLPGESSGFTVQGLGEAVGSDDGSEVGGQWSQISNPQSPIPIPFPLAPPIIVDVSPTVRFPLFALHSPVGAFVFSYLAGALLLGIGLLLGLAWRISRDQQIVLSPVRQTSTVVEPASETPLVARVTGTADCHWADPKTKALDRDGVPLGRKFAMASGCVEITYGMGAKVILEGPCMYEVESPRSGFLSFGKLTARVEAKKGTGPIGRNGPPPASGYSAAHHLDLSPFSPHGSGAKGERTANLALLEEESGPTTSLAPRPSTLVSKHDPQSTTGYPPFSVRTPTAIVTDLGTEFGVEVNRSGASRTHVFRGKVELRDVDQQGGSAIVLGVGETARAEPTNANHVKVIRVRSNASAFVRELPRPAPVRVFSTGVGLKPGDADPHWQIVAFSGDPTFKPQAAFVVDLRPVSVKGLTLPYQPNDPTRSQWLSTVSAMPALPRGTFTFRTTFEIGNVRPETVVLLGRFIVRQPC